jgi:5-methylcytosine-specific restriction protein A
MEITKEMIVAAYRVSKEIHNNQMSKNEAIELLINQHGMNHNSATDYINNFNYMMKGQKYSRTNNEEATEYYLNHILQDFGENQLVIALNAVDKHIIYYEGLGHGKLPGIRRIYEKYLKQLNLESNFVYPDEIDVDTYYEGEPISRLVNIYERDPLARKKCVEHYGARCIVCNFEFKQYYGLIGANFIHVHHLKQLSEIGKGYTVDPIQDLRPVCPNCHAILHRKKPAYSIEDLKELIRSNEEENNSM